MRRGTYSIVARDRRSGELGVGVQSHWFSVGAVVPWAEAGVGAVATQSFAEPAYGPGALALLREGQPAADALAQLVAADLVAAGRQVAVVDAGGRAAQHTGVSCIPYAHHVAGEQFTCQANMMARPGVPEAMAEVFAAAAGSLAERLLAALEGAERAGGDVRGRQSAALVVVPSQGEPWRRLVDLRVEDHLDPLGELRRLLGIHGAYAIAERADAQAAAGRHVDAAQLYARASAAAPENEELLFWAGLGAAQTGDLEHAVECVSRAIEANARLRTLLERLTPDIAPAAPAVRDALGL